jgi:hypothetical protein
MLFGAYTSLELESNNLKTNIGPPATCQLYISIEIEAVKPVTLVQKMIN